MSATTRLPDVARSAIGGVLVFAWCRWRGIRAFQPDGTLWGGIAAGLLFGPEFMLIFVGLEYTTVARSSLLVNTMPFWILVGAHFLLGERMSVRKFLGLARLRRRGRSSSPTSSAFPAPRRLTGDLLSLGAGLLWALTYIVIKGTKLAEPPPKSCCSTNWPVRLPWPSPWCRLSPGRPSATSPLLPTLALLFPGCLYRRFHLCAVVLAGAALSGIGPSSFTFLSPAFGVLCGGLLLGEPLTVQDFRGARPDRGRADHRQPAGPKTDPPDERLQCMRDILNDLEAGKQLSDPDPVRRAQIQMKTPLPKRFYKDVCGRSGRRLVLPCISTASRSARRPRRCWSCRPKRRQALVADEFAAQGETIDPMSMPVIGWSTRRSTASRATRRRCSKTSCASPRPTCSAIAPTPRKRSSTRQAEAWDPGDRLGPQQRSAPGSCSPKG